MKKNIFEIDELSGDFESHPEKWTCIIPAAGKGSRLGYNHPKILYPICEKPILHWLLELFKKNVDKIVLILSPEGEKDIREAIPKDVNVEIAIQEEPLGMAHAIAMGKSKTETENVAIVWGDQVLLKEDTITKGISLHEQNDSVSLTLPTVLKEEPYIHFERNENLKLTNVMQAREENIPYEVGESDLGLFFFKSQELFETIEDELKNKRFMGTKTKEFNLLPLLPLFEEQGGVQSMRINNIEESLGINTPEDAKQAEKILWSRKN